MSSNGVDGSGEKGVTSAFDPDDAFWRTKPLTPAQLLIHDISLGASSGGHNGQKLDINEKPAWSLLPKDLNDQSSWPTANKAARDPIEAKRFEKLENDYGWIRHLKWQPRPSSDAVDSDNTPMCRWIHISSRFPEYISAFYYALSFDRGMLSESIRNIDDAIHSHERSSRHGKYFTPFVVPLRDGLSTMDVPQPTLISIPWLDWSVDNPPPLRFQIDRREGFRSVRSSVHPLRSVLQHFFRLEDTSDREKSQVFTQHRPWLNNKELDLQIRQWYGHYPTSLVVDELWILIINAKNIVTFSSNVTWKSRWPPLQLSSRIADVAFRQVRDHFSRMSTPDYHHDYTAAAHAITALSGAVGMMHRSFWPDIPLSLTDRYAGFLNHLQYRLHRSPSTQLVMHLIACVDELNITIQITQQQMDLLENLQQTMNGASSGHSPGRPHSRRTQANGAFAPWEHDDGHQHYRRPPPAYPFNSKLTDSLDRCIENLQRELTDLVDLRDNTNALVTRTIQLVNIRLEDNNKAILTFTIVTIVFLPLNFIASFFGMNVSDIRNLDANQSLFWLVAVLVTFGIAVLSSFFAFRGGKIMEDFRLWRDGRRDAGQNMIRQHRAYG